MPIINSNLAETITIQENGVYDVAKYSGANVIVEPTLESIPVTPTTSAQTITPSSGVDGFSQVNVSPVTSSIDANIIPGNIKNNVSILGVTGTYTGGGGGGGNEPYIQLEVDNNMLTHAKNRSFPVDLCGARDIDGFVLAYAHAEDSVIQTVDYGSLTSLTHDYSLYATFTACSNLNSVDLSNLTNIGAEHVMAYCFSQSSLQEVYIYSLDSVDGFQAMGYCFMGCDNLVNLEMTNLTYIGSYSMEGLASQCSNLVTALFPNLISVEEGGFVYAFAECTSLSYCEVNSLYRLGSSSLNSGFMNSGLEEIYFPSLKIVLSDAFSSCFSWCTNLIHISFPALSEEYLNDYDVAFGAMLDGTENVTVHFPGNLQYTMSQFQDVIDGFGGTNTAVVFDLPYTYLIDAEISGNYETFERDPINDNISTTALAWRTQGSLPNAGSVVWTVGDSNPQTGDAVYENSDCTSQVSTISRYYSPLA